MDVFNISAGQAPKAAQSGNVEQHEAVDRSGERARKSPAVTDSFATSATARQVQGLVDRLVAEEASDVRTDLVERFRALMALGELDTPETAARAAEGMLDAPASE